MSRKNTTLLLAFFLGSFGAHWFYLGNKKLGILFLLFCWTGIPGIIGVISALVLFFMPEKHFEKWYAENSVNW